MDKVNQMMALLQVFNISAQSHSHSNLKAHLLGTYNLLLQWHSCEDVCLAGLCHSVYGTESYNKQSLPISERKKLQSLIGQRAERLTYLFGAHQKRSLWFNLVEHAPPGFYVIDRFDSTSIALTKEDFSDLVLISLANKLEQRPRQPKSVRNRLKREMIASRKFLPSKAWQAFVEAYELS